MATGFGESGAGKYAVAMRIAVTGATGLVGRAVVARLLARGDEVLALSRDPAAAGAALPAGVRAERFVRGDAGPAAAALSGCDGVVHLAGEPVLARRWNARVMEEIRASRVEGTAALVAALAAAAPRPRALVGASAVGLYGARVDGPLDETAPPGDDFLARVCVDWEAAASRAREHGVRVAAIRIGIVLSPEGGALPRLLPPFRFFAGGPIGRGRQGFPWIHVDDLASLFLFALDRDDVEGPLNAAAPQAVTNREFCRALGRALHRPSWLPVPPLALRLALGRVARVLAAGPRIAPRRALDLGFRFRHPDLAGALADLLSRRR